MYAKWALAPSGFYIAVVEFNNKHYYSYGRTPDHLEKNIATRLYQTEGVSTAQVHLEQRRSEQIDLQYATKIFMTRYVKPKINQRPVIVNKVLMAPPEPQEPMGDAPVNDNDEFICKEKDGYIVIYKLTEIKKYKMFKGE